MSQAKVITQSDMTFQNHKKATLRAIMLKVTKASTIKA